MKQKKIIALTDGLDIKSARESIKKFSLKNMHSLNQAVFEKVVARALGMMSYKLDIFENMSNDEIFDKLKLHKGSDAYISDPDSAYSGLLKGLVDLFSREQELGIPGMFAKLDCRSCISAVEANIVSHVREVEELHNQKSSELSESGKIRNIIRRYISTSNQMRDEMEEIRTKFLIDFAAKESMKEQFDEVKEQLFWQFARPLAQMGLTVRVYRVNKSRGDAFYAKTDQMYYQTSKGEVHRNRAWSSRFHSSKDKEDRKIPNNPDEKFIKAMRERDNILYEKEGRREFFVKYLNGISEPYMVQIMVPIESDKMRKEERQIYESDIEDMIMIFDSYLKNIGESLRRLEEGYKDKEAATTDGLTGLIAQKKHDEVLKSLINKAIRDNSDLAYSFMDIDNFSFVNDVFGHSVGDNVLEELGRVINEIGRDYDKGIRKGGEELINILLNASKSVAIKRSEELNKSLDGVNEKLGELLTVTDPMVGRLKDRIREKRDGSREGKEEQKPFIEHGDGRIEHRKSGLFVEVGHVHKIELTTGIALLSEVPKKKMKKSDMAKTLVDLADFRLFKGKETAKGQIVTDGFPK
jgi:diguanylate cyclase (GGDEF)-like protein